MHISKARADEHSLPELRHIVHSHGAMMMHPAARSGTLAELDVHLVNIREGLDKRCEAPLYIPHIREA